MPHFGKAFARATGYYARRDRATAGQMVLTTHDQPTDIGLGSLGSLDEL